MAKLRGNRSLTFEVPIDLWVMYDKFCIDNGITKTKCFIRYCEYLAAQQHRERIALHEQNYTPLNEVLGDS